MAPPLQSLTPLDVGEEDREAAPGRDVWDIPATQVGSNPSWPGTECDCLQGMLQMFGLDGVGRHLSSATVEQSCVAVFFPPSSWCQGWHD